MSALTPEADIATFRKIKFAARNVTINPERLAGSLDAIDRHILHNLEDRPSSYRD
jgi:hypothetical protein